MAYTFASSRLRVSDDPEALMRLAEAEGFGDGLPLVPPTPERVAAMLDGAGRDPGEVLGRLAPSWKQATVEKVAINAVMAGCRPEYFPVVLAAVEAVADPAFNLQSIQATTHICTPLVIVNGPIRKALGINCGHNCFGQGTRANATIGRALRLTLLNVGGAAPGEGDKATFGQPGKYSYCTGENEEANPWEPLHVERGFAPDQSTVTVIGAEAPHNVNDHGSTTGDGILMTVSSGLATAACNHVYLEGEPLVVFGPEHAATIARDGFTKADVKRFIFEHARVPIARISPGNREWFKGIRPAWFSDPRDDVEVPMTGSPEDIMVVVAGGAGKHSLVIPTFAKTRAVTRVIRPGPCLRLTA